MFWGKKNIRIFFSFSEFDRGESTGRVSRFPWRRYDRPNSPQRNPSRGDGQYVHSLPIQRPQPAQGKRLVSGSVKDTRPSRITKKKKELQMRF